MRRADWIFLLLVAVLGASSISLIVAAFLASGDLANLLIALGTTTAIGCLLLVAQVLHQVASRSLEQVSESAGGGKAAIVSGTERDIAQDEVAEPSTIVVVSRSSELHLSRLITDARHEVRAMVVSGRSFLSPQVLDLIEAKISNPRDSCVFRVLALDHRVAAQFVEARSSMIDRSRSRHLNNPYEQEFSVVRDYFAEITIDDPTRERFDVRLYDKLPTSYFYIIDGVLYLSALLSVPVSESPMIVIRPEDPESSSAVEAYASHFEHYWRTSRFFVSVIGIDGEGRTLLVRNRGRQLEWPTGYIEPNEGPASAAAREFREETGYEIDSLVEVGRTVRGYYFAGLIGDQVGSPSAREIASVQFVDNLPRQSEMSFPDEYQEFVVFLDRARVQVSQAC